MSSLRSTILMDESVKFHDEYKATRALETGIAHECLTGTPAALRTLQTHATVWNLMDSCPDPPVATIRPVLGDAPQGPVQSRNRQAQSYPAF